MPDRTVMRAARRLARLGAAPLALAMAASPAAGGGGVPRLGAELPGGISLRLSGQVGQGVLRYDDGALVRGYAPVDTANAPSHLRLSLTAEPGAAWEIGGRAEVAYAPYATDRLSLRDDAPDWSIDRGDVRHLEFVATRDGWGELSIGQGSMATDGVAENDLSGTSVATGSDLDDIAGGQLLRRRDGGLSDIAVADAFTNHDGLGRRTRLRYDTPRLAGFGLSASLGRDAALGLDGPSIRDLAATYDGRAGQVRVKAGIGWGGGAGTVISGSASALHEPAGISLTVAAGTAEGDAGDGRYGYVKLGVTRKLVGLGATSVSLDRWEGRNVGSPGSAGSSTGVAAVQAVEAWGIDLFLAFRSYRHERPLEAFSRGRAVLTGARFQF